LVRDGQGNLYGTTSSGGAGLFGCPQACGTVFKLDTAGNETVLHSFGETGRDGQVPYYGYLVRDGAGNLYGTTSYGGAHGAGTIFRVSASGKEVVFSFSGANGGFPFAGLVADAAGNFYGTTYVRGSGCPPYGCGTVFEVTSKGKETVLHSFMGAPDGDNPFADLVLDSAGNLYGTTATGGFGAGTVFKLDPSGAETVLYSFTGGPDGGLPFAGLVRDSAGNLYGTTLIGGTSGVGTVFKLDSTGMETVLYNFCSQSGCADGSQPYASLVRDSAGNLYGTTYGGGSNDGGTVFRLDKTGKETVLHSFCSLSGCADGGFPYAGLVGDSSGNLYGTTSNFGAYAWGTVFEITP
ncbi:MAG: choice-of-anchor tandem repeat GloVer-containing protein, partial [Terriglobales bacterium]